MGCTRTRYALPSGLSRTWQGSPAGPLTRASLAFLSQDALSLMCSAISFLAARPKNKGSSKPSGLKG
ncbi:hypothetical protein GBA65_22010 (plasmid) [Rubrobacter marinus]|uniref:Uncharacterized protein n=1 Tax=Rubrobacter marinus TaxID=2653852 RepID=A0A6G8Q3R7_9ACTN|nr:hypothetical protein GBA65_22010 [Rubrobacter marinus]